MNPVTHLLTSWTVASLPAFGQRDRLLVTVAGIIPDVDGLGIVAEIVTRESESPLLWWSAYHHVLGHNLLFGVLVFMIFVALARDKLLVGLFSFIVFHLHLLLDLVGSRGPEGYVWPVPYFFPFSDVQIAWSGQWALNALPNILFTVLLIFIALFLAWYKGFSILGLVSTRYDEMLVTTLRGRFGTPGGVHKD